MKPRGFELFTPDQQDAWRKHHATHVRAYQHRNAGLVSIRKRQELQALRAEVYDHYGWACACCGESSPWFLTISHVNDDGAEHKRQLGGHARECRTDTVLRDIIRRNFPDDFEVLCYNCNCAKEYSCLGSCPHQLVGA